MNTSEERLPLEIRHLYEPTLDLTGWWKGAWTFSNWPPAPDEPAEPITSLNQPPLRLYSDGLWQTTTFTYLQKNTQPAWGLGQYGGDVARLWTNGIDPALPADVTEETGTLFHNGYVVQDNQSGALTESAGEWFVTTFVPAGGVLVTARLAGNGELQGDGDSTLLALWAANPILNDPAALFPQRPVFSGTWLSAKSGMAGDVTLSPQQSAPPSPPAHVIP